MWSLGVEEQFYLMLPLLLVGIRRWKPNRQLDILVLIALASLASSEVFRSIDEASNFFFTPSRVWELLIGSCTAALVMGKTNPVIGTHKSLREALAACGLAAILTSILVMDANTPSPSVYMLIPTIGTAVLLMFGGETFAARLLSVKPALLIGASSYSIYLWHQPVMAFSTLLQKGAPSESMRMSLVILSMLLGWISWRRVERPFRTRLLTTSKKTLAWSALCLLAIGSMTILALSQTESPQVQLPKSLLDSFDPPARTKECFDIPYAHNKATGWTCSLGADRLAPSFMLFGDSHALQLLDAVSHAAQLTHRSGLFAGFSGCVPLLDVYPLTRRHQTIHDCRALNERVLHLVKEKGIREVILIAKWSYYNTPWQPGNYLNAIGLTPDDEVNLESSRRAFREGLRRTVEAYERIGVKLHVIEQVPQQTLAPDAIYQRAWHEGSAAMSAVRAMSVSRREHQRHQAFSNEAIHSALTNRSSNAINLDHLFCDSERCLVGTGDRSYYQDKSHLSEEGALRTIPFFTSLLRSGDGSRPQP